MDKQNITWHKWNTKQAQGSSATQINKSNKQQITSDPTNQQIKSTDKIEVGNVDLE